MLKAHLAFVRHMADDNGQMAQQGTRLPASTSREVIETIRKGFPAARLDQMAQLLAVERPIFLALVGLSERTLQRKTQTAARLSPAVSDRLARMDRIILLATEVFGAKEKAVQWLKRPSRALGAEMPLQLLDTDTGTQRVERELRQIQYSFVY
ncbi:MAG: antitoxin Xre/MbcA/ParS toxin-binding domain-containing protein [Bryobacteraceae bacterium]